MKNRWLIGLILAFTLLILGIVGCNSQASGSQSAILTNQQQGIWVNGQGKVAVVPDLAQLTFGVQSQEKSVAAAQAIATDAMNKIILALTSNGVESKDIQTQRFSIQIVTRYDDTTRQEITIGYLVTNVINAKIWALDQVGTIIDAVVSAGGNLTRIEGITFTIDDPSVYYTQSREKAIADAKYKAEQIAKLSGVSLGKPTLITESFNSPITISPIKVGTPNETPISQGEINITATVQIAYAISE